MAAMSLAGSQPRPAAPRRSRPTAIWAGSRADGPPGRVLVRRSRSSSPSRAARRLAVNTAQGIRLQRQGEVKLDETTSPRKLDWINFSSADQQEFPQIPGIYKLDGDTFTVCNGGMNGSRPKEFKPGDGVLSEVVVFQRERVAAAEKTKPAAPTTK